MPVSLEEKRHYFDPLFDMFQTQGWHVLMLDMEEARDDINRIDNIKTVEELHFQRGVLHAYSRMLVYADTIERVFHEQEEGDDEDAETV